MQRLFILALFRWSKPEASRQVFAGQQIHLTEIQMGHPITPSAQTPDWYHRDVQDRMGDVDAVMPVTYVGMTPDHRRAVQRAAAAGDKRPPFVPLRDPFPCSILDWITCKVMAPIIRWRVGVFSVDSAAADVLRSKNARNLDEVEFALDNILLYAQDPEYTDRIRETGAVEALVSILELEGVRNDEILARLAIENLLALAQNTECSAVLRRLKVVQHLESKYVPKYERNNTMLELLNRYFD